jgi:16S rRNA (adenine1518-N6/adenine1519-N6)-dimethyltransferase
MTTVRSILKDYGIRPRKNLGQSFLEDKNVINKIILAADIHDQDIVVEIGAGLGIMTEILASQAGKVIAIDVDPRMTAILRERLRDQPRVEIIEKDVLACDFSALLNDRSSAKLKVIGNIPYNILLWC